MLFQGDNKAMRMNQIIDLSSLPPGTRAKVVDIVAGSGLRIRLLQMGLTPGTELEIVDKHGGVIVIRFRGTVLGISKGIARKIFVLPL